MTKERLQMISDGVLAIILTVMVLEIKVPQEGEGFSVLLQHIGIYALSFVVIAIMWLNHHHIFISCEHVSIKVTWLNFMLLFFMSLIPLPTQFLGEHFFDKNAHCFYGIIMCVTASSYSLLQQEVSKTSTHLTDTEKAKINRANWISTSIYFLSIPLSFVSIYLSALIFIALPAFYFVPSRVLKKNPEQ